MWDGHFTNISVETRVQSSYVDCLFGLPCDLGGILVYDVKIRDGGQRMVEILTMFKYGRGCGLGVFFDPLTKGPRGFSNVGGVAPICLAFPMVD